MPNGRSGGFLIPKGDLATLLAALPQGSRVGPSVASAAGAKASGSLNPELGVNEVMALLDTFAPRNIWVEEQDHRWYIVHLDRAEEDSHNPDPAKWILVASQSPAFLPLREYHARPHPPMK